MRNHSEDQGRWGHEVGRNDWYNQNEFDSFRPPRRYYRTSSGTSVPHHHHHEKGDHPGHLRRDQRFNKFDHDHNRYVMKYDMGRGRYHASYGDGYADSPRADDRDWDNGRNTYWRERYHHQGHENDRSWYDRIGEKVKALWNEWRSGDDYENENRAHRRGYSSNYRDHDNRYEDYDHNRSWHVDDEYFRH